MSDETVASLLLLRPSLEGSGYSGGGTVVDKMQCQWEELVARQTSGRGLNPASGLEPTEGVGGYFMQGREQLLACLQWGEEERESNEKERDEQMHHSVIGGCKGYERRDACKAGEDSYH